MRRDLTRTAVALGALVSLAGSGLGGASVHQAVAGAAPHVCLTPSPPGAAARGAVVGRGHDTRGITATQQRAIETRTRRILAARTARRTTANRLDHVPVYVHVMTSRTGAGNVTDSQIAQQITVLNQTYSGHDVDRPGRLDTGVRFYLAGANRYANSTWHTDGDSETYRARTRQGGPNALNIWVVHFAYLGIATFPWDDAADPSIDGIRVEYAAFPGGSATHYDQGETVTHETGHWLGLYHTFQGGCSAEGDSVSDTAAQASPSSGCPTGRDSCTAPGKDPIHDYMDYSYDSCYYQFTAGQSARIQEMWTAYRA
ncbi:MAG: zinc metalloprotease [Marmoricola sp.]